jgi:hypothetical protein
VQWNGVPLTIDQGTVSYLTWIQYFGNAYLLRNTHTDNVVVNFSIRGELLVDAFNTIWVATRLNGSVEPQQQVINATNVIQTRSINYEMILQIPPAGELEVIMYLANNTINPIPIYGLSYTARLIRVIPI